MSKHIVEVTVKVEIELDSDLEVTLEEVVNEMDYSMTSTTDGASVVDTEIINIEVI